MEQDSGLTKAFRAFGVVLGRRMGELFRFARVIMTVALGRERSRLGK